MTPDSAMMEREIPRGGMPIVWEGVGVVGWWRGDGTDGRVHIQHSLGTPLLCGDKREDIGGWTIVIGDMDDSVAMRDRRIKQALRDRIDPRLLAAQYGLPVDAIRRMAKAAYRADPPDGLTDDERAELELRRMAMLARAPAYIAASADAGVLCEACGSAWTGMRAC